MTTRTSKTESSLEIIEIDPSVRSVVRQRVKGVEQIESFFQHLQHVEVPGRNQHSDGLSVLLYHEPRARGMDATSDFGDFFTNLTDGDRNVLV